LQEAPEWLDRLAREQVTTDADVVYGVQATRGGGRLERWGSTLFYKLFNALSDVPIPPNLMTVRLMSRRYVQALLQHRETTFVISGLWARTGFRQQPLQLSKQRTRHSTYNLLRRAATFVHALASFSSKPLIFVFYLGSAIMALSALLGAALVTTWLVRGFLPGWPSLMASLWFLGGLIIFCQGIHGIYLSRVFLESKRRPIAIVRHVYEPPEEPCERARTAA
jgi:putative glycosyltransferase